MQIDKNNKQTQIQQHQTLKLRPPVAESFLRSSNKMIECHKCKQMIHFQKIDIHEGLCKGERVECSYCPEKVTLSSINLHQLTCPVKRKIDQQERNKNLKLKKVEPKKPTNAQQPSPKLENKQNVQIKPANSSQRIQRVNSMKLLYDQRQFYVNPEQKKPKVQNNSFRKKQYPEVKPERIIQPEIKPEQQVFEELKSEINIEAEFKRESIIQKESKPERKVEEKRQTEVKIEKTVQRKTQVEVNPVKKAKVNSVRKISEAEIKPKQKVEQPRQNVQQKVEPKIQRPQPRRVQTQIKIPANRYVYQPPNRQNQAPDYRLNQNRPPLSFVPQQPVRNNGFIRRNNIPVEEIPFIPPEPKGKNPLTETKIKRLPRVSYQPDEENAQSQCSICYLDFEENEDLVGSENCKHLFHHECLTPWLQTDNRCPNCKMEVKVPPKV